MTEAQVGGSFLLSGDQDRNLQPIVQTLFPWPPQPLASAPDESRPANPVPEPPVIPAAAPAPAPTPTDSPHIDAAIDADGWRSIGIGRLVKSNEQRTFIALDQEVIYLERTAVTPYRLTVSLLRQSGGPHECGLEINRERDLAPDV